MESLLQEWLHRANWNVLAWLPWFQIFTPFLLQSIVCVWDSGRRLVLVSCKLMITFYWQWAPQKAFVGCKKQNNGGAPGGNLSKIFQVFVKNLGIIWPKWEHKKVDTTRLTPWCEPLPKVENSCFNLLVRIKVDAKSADTQRAATQARSIAF